MTFVCKQCVSWRGDAAKFTTEDMAWEHLVRYHSNRVIEAKGHELHVGAFEIEGLLYNQSELQK